MLSYGEIQRDPGKLPEATLKALLARGFSHVLGNEVSAKVVARVRSHLAGAEGKADDVSTDAVKAFRKDNAETVIKWTAEAQADALKSMDEGTLGVRGPGGPRVDPVTSAMRNFAWEAIKAILKAQNLKVPTGEDTVTLQKGTPNEASYTREQLIERRLAHPTYGPKHKHEAERHVAAEAKRKAAAVGEASEL